MLDSLGDNPIFIIDDSDIVKPLGEKFEELGIVRNGSSKDKEYQKGYQYTEIIGLTKKLKQPISIFSKIHSSTQKDYLSNNSVTLEGIDKIVDLLKVRNQKGIFVNDRGYDNNIFFNYYFQKQQHFVIRLKEDRNVYCNHKRYKITTIRDSKKGKIKMKVIFQGEEKECYSTPLYFYKANFHMDTANKLLEIYYKETEKTDNGLKHPASLYFPFHQKFGLLLLRFLNADLSNYEKAYKAFFYAYGFEILKDLDEKYKFELNNNYDSNENYLKATNIIFEDFLNQAIQYKQKTVCSKFAETYYF